MTSVYNVLLQVVFNKESDMKMNIQIRKENINDYEEIYSLVKVAFELEEHSDGDEQNLVNRLRNSDAYISELALVAELDGKIIGHIMFTIVHVEDAVALELGPLAVLPGFQGKGIGGMLIKTGHEIARKMGYEFIILVGHADYYPRFGYIPASTFGICSHFEIPQENHMAYNLKGKDTRLEGVVKYPKAWGIE